MIQLLLHLWGDYILQNDWMATNKTKPGKEGFDACLVHTLFYSVMFVPVVSNPLQWMVIAYTHFVIDRYRLAIPLIRLKNWCWDKESTTGFPTSTPPWLAFWLVIIIDNILHITINYLSLTYL